MSKEEHVSGEDVHVPGCDIIAHSASSVRKTLAASMWQLRIFVYQWVRACGKNLHIYGR